MCVILMVYHYVHMYCLVTLKHQQSFMEIWKAYAPPSLFGGSDDCKKIVVAMKPTAAVPALGEYSWLVVSEVGGISLLIGPSLLLKS